MLNKSAGNMYNFTTHTWNPIQGRCPHNCSYCYIKRFPVGELRLNEKSIKDNLGKGNFIFIGSSCDMFADAVPDDWIFKVLDYIKKFPDNKYLFQTKNVRKLCNFVEYLPKGSVIGTTIETNRHYPEIMNASPKIEERVEYLELLSQKAYGFEIMITIEPVLDFDLQELVELIKRCKPKWVNIGADSKNHKMPEPEASKVSSLIKELKKFTEVKNKSNLGRLLT